MQNTPPTVTPFKSFAQGTGVAVSIRMVDGSLLLGSLNAGQNGRLDVLMASSTKFFEFASRSGQIRFIAAGQIASVEPLRDAAEPKLGEPLAADGYTVLGIDHDATLEQAMAAFEKKLEVYSEQRWSAPNVPPEFTRFAVAKTRHLNAALTEVKAAIHLANNPPPPPPRPTGPMFGTRL